MARSGFRRTLKRPTAWLATLVVAAIVTSAVAYIFSTQFWRSAARQLGVAAPVLRVQVITDVDRFHSGAVHIPMFVVPGAAVLPAPPSGARPDGRWAWAHDLGGVDAEETLVRLVLTGRSAEPVIVQDARVRLIERRAPIRRGTFITYRGLGAAQGVRHFAVSLDRDSPLLRHIGSEGVPDAHFPLRVTDADVEVFDILARTSACDCSWIVELDYTAAGEEGTLRIGDDGQPFRTTAGGAFASMLDESVARAFWAPARVWSERRWESLENDATACGPRAVGDARIVVLTRGAAGSCGAVLAAVNAHLSRTPADAARWTCADAVGATRSNGEVAYCRDPSGAVAVAIDGDRQARALAHEDG